MMFGSRKKVKVRIEPYFGPKPDWVIIRHVSKEKSESSSREMVPVRKKEPSDADIALLLKDINDTIEERKSKSWWKRLNS